MATRQGPTTSNTMLQKKRIQFSWRRQLNVVSFFYKNEGKRRFVIAFKIVIGLCYFAMNTTQVGFESLFPRQLSATNRAFVVRSILVDYLYIG